MRWGVKWASVGSGCVEVLGHRPTFGVSQNVDADGIVGPRTIKAAHDGGLDAVVRFLAERAVRYHETMRDVPSLNVFAHNWYFRLFSLARLVLG